MHLGYESTFSKVKQQQKQKQGFLLKNALEHFVLYRELLSRSR
jgi:hypothetical protein